MKKRIGIVLPGLRSGGVESIFLGVTNCLLARGHEVDLVLLSLLGDYQHSIPSGVRLFGTTLDRVDPTFHAFLLQNRNLSDLRLSNITLLSKEIKYRWYFRRLSESPRKSQLARDAEIVHRYLLARNPQILISGPTVANWACILGSQALTKKPCTIVTAHTNYALGLDANKLQCSRLLYPRADWIVGVSRGVTECASNMLQLPPHNITHIYNGFQIYEIQKKANSETDTVTMLRQFGVPAILSIGRLSTDGQKDLDTVIKAFAVLRRTSATKLVLLCPGDHAGSQMARLRSLCVRLSVLDDVVFLGFDENPYALMKHASVLVVSSHWEGLPSVLIEAMACGTPVVSTDSPFGPVEILDNGRYGPLVPIGDADQMAMALEAVLHGGHPSTEQLQARATDFSIERMADQYERLFSDIC